MSSFDVNFYACGVRFHDMLEFVQINELLSVSYYGLVRKPKPRID